MLRAIKAVATAFLFASAPLALQAGAAQASGLADAYNHQTDTSFRTGMQMRLAWTGDYKGDFSGAIAADGLRAIRDFQARHGMEANGVINEPFLQRLVASSEAAQTAVGFQLVDDSVTGARVGLPLGLVVDNGPTPIGRVWRSADRRIEVETVRMAGQDLSSVRALLTQPTATRTVDSDIGTTDGFVISGRENNRFYVMRFKGTDGDVRGFGVSYDRALAATMAPYAQVATNLFDPDLSAGEGVATASLDVSRFGVRAVEAAADDKPSRRLSALFGASARLEEPAAAPETDSSGSGFVVSKDGWVLTNAHVAASCRAVMVGDKGLADKIVVDEDGDLAALHVGARFTRTLAIAESGPRLGEDVLALGFPLRSILADSLNVTRGNVSSLLGLQNDPRYLQTSAPVQRGNSGGPLVDLSGRVVGVVTAKLDAVAVADATGDIPQSINFAIRPDAARDFLSKNGIDFASAPATTDFTSVADTTAKVQDAVVPILCIGNKAH